MKELILELPYDVYNRLEIMAARDDKRIAEAVQDLLTYLVRKYEGGAR